MESCLFYLGLLIVAVGLFRLGATFAFFRIASRGGGLAVAAKIDEAIRTVTARDISLFRLLTTIRNPARLFRRQRESILNPSEDRPILDVATHSGFFILSDEPGREIVIGSYVVRPRAAPPPSPAAFATLPASGYARAAMNFRIEPQSGGWCLVTTETRVFATDRQTARRFAVYWRMIYPGSSLIRTMWLRAIARRALYQPQEEQGYPDRRIPNVNTSTWIGGINYFVRGDSPKLQLNYLRTRLPSSEAQSKALVRLQAVF